jgi:hypothetical protein
MLRWSLSLPRWSLLKLRWSLIFICPVVLSQSPAITPNYSKIFGHDYEYALTTIKENSWWTDTLKGDGLGPAYTLAVIFPELIRYSSIADYIEVQGLEVLYVQYGGDYADFSVGFFQMKPSFAEHIESDLIKYSLPGIYPPLSTLKPDLSETVNARRDRVFRLKDEYYQLLYLEAFIRIMETQYPDSIFDSTEDKLVYYATAYNTGYFKDEAEIRKEISRNRFYVGMMATSSKYNYSDIALRFYLSNK